MRARLESSRAMRVCVADAWARNDFSLVKDAGGSLE